MELKYVMVDVAFAGLVPFVFPESVGHEIPVLGLGRNTLDSAGFVSLGLEGNRLVATAYGRSVGLDLSADVERDSRILTRFFNRGESELLQQCTSQEKP